MPKTPGGPQPWITTACPLSRRALLRAAALSACAPALALLPACGSAPPPPPASVTLPLDTLPLGQRVIVKVGAVPVEVVRTAAGATARSLVCTHQGCTVAWVEEKQRYKCPWQDAWFDAEGQPVTGPVTQPLASMPAPVSNGSVTLTEHALAVPAKRS
jgi:cytochrome b6-f complex iron-sulfur subunit